MLTLYYAPNACSRASHITLAKAGADYTARRVNFAQSEQRTPDYLKLNPKGRVPVLVTPQGVLTETPAILLYIAQTFPGAGLAPLADAFALAKMNSFLSFMCSTVHVNHAHRVRGNRWADDESALESMKKKVPQTMGDAFALIENEYFQGPWVMGDRFTVCDPYLFTIAGWLGGDGVDIARFPKVNEHFQRMAADPVVAKVVATEQAPA